MSSGFAFVTKERTDILAVEAVRVSCSLLEENQSHGMISSWKIWTRRLYKED